MFFDLKGYAELAFLALQLEFANLLFSDEILGILITLVILEFEVTNCSLSSMRD
jgi:hypothetical protein